jgi:nucleoside-diphosphate-sugar epimerase
MKILITGGSGFVGMNLIKDQQDRGRPIINVSRTAAKANEISWHDFLSDQSKKDYDTLIHLAGKAHDIAAASKPAEYFDINTELTRKVFDTFLTSNAHTFIYMSSVKAVADTVPAILTEDAVASPRTAYGQSKLKAEEYILSKPLQAGKRVFILRPCMIHGPGNKGNLNLLYKFVVKHIPYPFAAFANKRSFLSVDNLSYIVEQIISDNVIPGGIYNVADDEPLSTNEVVKIISEASGIKSKLWQISPKLIISVASVGDKLRLPLNSERLKKLTESYVVSNDKIKKALKINNLPLSSRDGLKKTIAGFGSTQG